MEKSLEVEKLSEKTESVQKISYGSRFVRVGNKPMLEKTPIVRTFNAITHEWTKKRDDKNAKLIDITELGWTKKLVSKVIVKRTIADQNSMTGEKELFFLQQIKYKVGPRYNWVYIKRENSKVMIRDFMTGITFEAPKKSSDYVDVYKNDGKAVTKEDVIKLVENNEIDGIYSKILETEDGTVYGHRVYTKAQQKPLRS